MITRVVTTGSDGRQWTLHHRSVERLNKMLAVIAQAYEDDPGTSDLDDEQPSYITGIDLGDVRLAKQLTRN